MQPHTVYDSFMLGADFITIILLVYDSKSLEIIEKNQTLRLGKSILL
jgi:hypothetical protein